MPFKSKAQRRKFYAMANRGEISKKTVEHWEEATHGKKLPERVKKAVEAVAIKLAPTAPSPPLAPAVAIAAAPTIAKLKAQAIYKVSSIEHDEITGGKADNKSDSDFDPKQVAKGIKVEREHTDDPRKAKEIAEDHLTEFDHYYDALDKMEEKLKEGKTAAYQLGVRVAFIKLGSRVLRELGDLGTSIAGSAVGINPAGRTLREVLPPNPYLLFNQAKMTANIGRHAFDKLRQLPENLRNLPQDIRLARQQRALGSTG